MHFVLHLQFLLLYPSLRKEFTHHCEKNSGQKENEVVKPLRGTTRCGLKDLQCNKVYGFKFLCVIQIYPKLADDPVVLGM